MAGVNIFKLFIYHLSKNFIRKTRAADTKKSKQEKATDCYSS